MTEFYQTRMGHQFYEGTVPRLVRAIERVADALEAPKPTPLRELADLLSRAAAALETPQDLKGPDILHLIEDLRAEEKKYRRT